MLNKNHMNHDYLDSLKATYKNDPCKVLPYPLWKAEMRVDIEKSEYDASDGNLATIYGSNENGLEFFWNNDRKVDSRLQQLVEWSNYIMIHDDYFKKLETSKFNHRTAFFRLIHDKSEISTLTLPHGYSIRDVHIEAEVSQISAFIATCYEHLKPCNDVVLKWTLHKVFDKRLWIWIKDENGEHAALGIAEIDETVPEASLEWIQVHPKYQGKGLGKVLVLELLNRVATRVDFTTVSGECDNETNPERLYRSCGFAGSDVWWHLR